MGKCFIPHRLFTDPHFKSELYVWAFYFILIIHARKFPLFSWCTFAVAVAVGCWFWWCLGIYSIGDLQKTFALSAYTQAFSEISGIITMFYVVRALSPYTEYEFYVIAVNNIGRGPPSIPATTTTGETGKKQTFKRIVMNSHCLSLSGFSHFYF